MFPIYHQSGKAIAFGGRIFNSDDPAKYLNSPETPLYRKSEVFYGLHETRDSIRKFSTAVLVEGYTDFLQLVQLGIPNVVALSGTALGKNHATQIRKFASKVYLAYDGDSAGINATLRAGYVLFQAGVEPLVIPIPKDKDPDDWVREEGVDAFQEALGSSIPLLLFHLKKKNIKNLSGTDKSRIVKEILNEISLIGDGIIRDDLLKSLSQELNIDEVELFRIFKQQTESKSIRRTTVKPDSKPKPFTNASQKAQLEIIKTMAFNFDEVYPSMESIIDFQIFDEPILKKIGVLLIKDNKAKDLSAIIDQFEDQEEKRLVSEILFDDVNSDDPKLIIKDCFVTIRRILIKDQIKQARTKIKELESKGHDSKEFVIHVTELQKSLQQLTDKIEIE